MNQLYLPLVAGLIGALIGAFGSVATVWIQSRHETRRHRVRLAVDAAMRDAEIQHELAKAKQAAGTRVLLPPLSLYFFHYAELLKLLEADTLTPATYRTLMERQQQLFAAIGETQR